ncbi:MAG TPA: fructosamine kinase family protein [Chryseosolibacter sp.]|nr:fructosamine kinase family protein [Chryseosolibacter sp.]
MIPTIPSAIAQDIEAQTGSIIRGFSFSSGGCINHGGKLSGSRGDFFLKWNDANKLPAMFETEARGLSLLRSANALAVPEVIHVGQAGVFQYLLLEHIEPAGKVRQYWKHFGSGLAALHKNSSDRFGLDHNNYIGSLPQQNTESPSWVEFFVERRLKVQLIRAHDQGKIDRVSLEKFDALFDKLSSMFPQEPPALLHGDLWGGNIMTDARGEPCLIDPAVYYGQREADLAMTQLFGGFDNSFLESYGEVYPLEPGYKERFDLYNLYPLLVHVNLFGGGYLRQVMSVVEKFV